jgi:Tol biopolymer transport system component
MAKIEPGLLLKERYKITKQLGSGGMGEVFQADDLSLETQVAVKINHNLNETTSAQFIREARLLAGLKHPNLPRVIDYFTDDECQYLVMDYIPGDDLKTIVERHDAITSDQIIKWGVELGNALNYLHNHKPPIYHRDIKPANIKLTPSGEVVLVDFGIAKAGEASQETWTGAWAFSPGFAPPEQVSGMRTGPYSDQYSLAATLYYLYTGKPPADAAKRMMGEVFFTPLKEILPNVPDSVSNAITRALSIKPDERFTSISDFVSGLTNPTAVIGGGDAQVTMMAPRASAIPNGPLPPVPAAPIDTSPRGRKRSPVLGIVIGIAVLAVLGIGGYLIFGPKGNQAQTPTATLMAATPTQAATEAATQEQATSAPEVTPTGESTPVPTWTVIPTAQSVAELIGHGGKVAFISNRQADGYDQIWLMDVGKDANGKLVASNFTQLTTSEGDKSDLNWSPDGTKLLYSALSKQFAQNGDPYGKDIWMLDLTKPDAAPVDLTQRAGDDVEPAWDPTADQIAFTSYYRKDGLPQLFIMNTDGSNQTRLSERFAEHSATWTPDGSYLMYVMDYADFYVLSMRDVWTKFVDTRKFDQSSDAGRLGLVSQPSISNDGLLIAYTRTIGSKTNVYTAVFADRGRTITQITDSNLDNQASWSPDNQWILFTSTRDENSEIYIVSPDGQTLTNLTNFPAEDSDAVWQPLTKSQ